MKNKEIEELLNKAEDIAKYGADGKQHTRMFNQFEAKALLSYIEQLENNRDKAIEILERHTRFSIEELIDILKGGSDDTR